MKYEPKDTSEAMKLLRVTIAGRHEEYKRSVPKEQWVDFDEQYWMGLVFIVSHDIAGDIKK